MGGDRRQLPAAARAARRRRAADAVADAGAVRPARSARLARALRDVRRGGAPAHARGGRGRPARRRPRAARARARALVERLRGRARGARVGAAATCSGRSRRTRSGPRRRRTPCCRCWRATPACACRCAPASTRTARASTPTPAAPEGTGWRGGFWLPECAYAPRLEPLLEHAGVRATCVELTGRSGSARASTCGRSSARPASLLVPIDRATISLVVERAAATRPTAPTATTTTTRSTTTTRGATTASAYDHARALARAREHAADFVARTLARLREARRAACRAAGSSCARVDTELLGHWWYEGVAWLAAVVEECARQGLELLRLDDALERVEPAPWRDVVPRRVGAGMRAASSWGKDGDLSTWSGPAVAEIAFAARAAELDVLAAGAARRRGGGARAARAAGERLGVHGLARDRRALRARALRRASHGVSRTRSRRAPRPTRRGCASSRATPTARRCSRREARRHGRRRYSKRIARGASRMRISARRHAADDGVLGHVARHDRARADDAVVADGDAAQDARAVADPDVVPDAHVALVDALQADRALDLGHAVVEVDQHHAVGEDALAPDRDVLVGGDRALLADHRLRADRDLALVHADLAAVPDPRPAADAQRRVRGRSRA